MTRGRKVVIHLDDRRIVRRMLAGDERAFHRFFDENFPRLYRFAVARLPDDPEAVRDIVQTTMTRALAGLHSYRGESALFTWLCAICRNEAADWGRRNARHATTVVRTEDHPEIRAALESLDAPPPDRPEAQYRRTEVCRLIQVALDHLPPKYGDALEWKYIEGRSVREIATRLELSVEAAQSLLARARRAFRETYSALTGPILTDSQTDHTGP